MYEKFVKRMFDIILSLVAMPFVLLAIAVFAPFIFLTDRGPVFYNAPRVGKDGKVFKMFKLRSMKVNAPDIRNADGSTYNSANDPRVTKIGKLMRKTSVDELPQMLNVFLGHMSLIGPRPATPKILEDITPLKEARFKVRPGVTGYTQMMYRNSAQGDARYEADKYYVDNISFALDVKILFMTVLKVLKRENIYNDGSAKKEEKVPENIGGRQA
ncbi:MAG: sugar transferase [Ruminococcaceae bacterium]|nr:sugar transferase [Oscillospiraceae bacterium]